MATAQDAELILKLYDLRREPELRKARDWLVREFKAETYAQFKEQCPFGSDANRYFRMVSSYWDMAGALVNQGAVDATLFFETNGEFLIVWRKIAPWIEDLRTERNTPTYLRNLERLAQAAEAYRQQRA